MSPLLGVLLLVLLGLLGSRFSFSARRGTLRSRLLISSGTHFLFLGFFLGSNVLGLLTHDLIGRLYPFLALGLGWIGFLFGIQLERRQLARFPASFLAVAVVQAAVAFAVFLLLGGALLAAFDQWSPQTRIALVAAAAAASVSAPSAIALVRHNFLVRGRVSELLLFVASLDAVVGITALQLTFSFFHPAGAGAASSPWSALQWIAAALGLGIALAVVFLWLTRPKPEPDELTLFLLGLVVFGAGSALYLGLSPLFVCATAGAVVANMSPLRRRIYGALSAWEKPIFVVMMILAGAMMEFPTWLVVPLAAAYALLRGLGKLAGGLLAGRLVRESVDVPRRLGAGLIPQGGISLAMVISAILAYGALRTTDAALAMSVLFSTVVLGVAASDLAGPFLTRGLLRRAGEIHPRVEAALAAGRAPTAAEALGRDGAADGAPAGGHNTSGTDPRGGSGPGAPPS